MHPHSIILDGHTCSGKSEIGHLIADRLFFKYVKPFDGTVGEINRFLVQMADQHRLIAFRSCILDYFSASTATVPCVFDRFQPSTLSLIPQTSWPLELEDAARTIILWCDEETTARRLAHRGRDIWTSSQHSHFIKCFREIAETYHLRLIDTSHSKIDLVADEILAYAGISARQDSPTTNGDAGR